MSDLPTPNDRVESLLMAILTGDGSDLPTPRTRTEKLLMAIYENGGTGGGGTGGVTPAQVKTILLANTDGVLNGASENPIQNKAIVAALADYVKSTDLNIPTKVSELTNDKKYQTDTDVANTLTPYAKSDDVTKEIIAEIAKIVADAPESFNTLKEMADWIEHHEDDATAMNSAIQKNKEDIAALQTDKVDKETGKGLSTNDLTDELKAQYDKAEENTIDEVQVNGAALEVKNKAVNIDLSGYASHDEIVGENIIAYPYVNTNKSTNGIEFVDNGDGTVTATGTATDNAYFYLSLPMTLKAGTYVFSNNGLVDSTKVHMQIYLYETPYTTFKATTTVAPFTIDSDCDVTIRLNVLSGETVDNYTFKPMLEIGSIAHAYQPYDLAKAALRKDITTLQVLEQETENRFKIKNSVGTSFELVTSQGGIRTNKVLGNTHKSKNLVKRPYYMKVEHTSNGLTIKQTEDGCIIINGTSTAVVNYQVNFNGMNKVKAGTYTVSGCPTGGSNTSYYLLAEKENGMTYVGRYAQDLGDGATFTVSEDDANNYTLRICICCKDNYTFNNVIFKPMLVEGSEVLPYEPYGILSSGDHELYVKNLAPYPYTDSKSKTVNGITFTVNADDTITVNGTATGLAEFAILSSSAKKKILEKGKVYSISGCPSGGSKETYYMHSRYLTDTEIAKEFDDFGDGCTLSYDGEYTRNSYAIAIKSGTTVNNLVFKPMIVEGDTPAEYEQPLTFVEADSGEIEIKENGKNLIPFPYYNSSDTRVGITAKVNDDTSISLKGTATNNYFFVLLHRDYNGKGFAEKLRGKKITISGGSSRPVLSLAVYDKDGNNVTPPKNEMVYDFGGGVTITVPDNACDLYSYYYFSSGNTVDVTLRPQLEVSEFATEYEMYKSNTVSIPLSEPLRSIGNIKDEITKDGIVRRIGSYIIDGTEFWALYDGNITEYGVSFKFGDYSKKLTGIIPTSENIADIVTNILQSKIVFYSPDTTEDIGSGIYRTAGNIWFSFNKSDMTKLGIEATVDSWKSWIASNQVVILYILETPIIEQLTAEQKIALNSLVSFKDKTYIDTSDVYSKATLEIDYSNSDAGSLALQNENELGKLKQAIIELGGTISI